MRQGCRQCLLHLVQLRPQCIRARIRRQLHLGRTGIGRRGSTSEWKKSATAARRRIQARTEVYRCHRRTAGVCHQSSSATVRSTVDVCQLRTPARQHRTHTDKETYSILQQLSNYYPRRQSRSVGVGKMFASVCLFVCLSACLYCVRSIILKKNDLKVFKLGVGNDLGIS